MYRDTVEIDELKHPIAIRFLRLMPGTGGAGKFRGAPAMEVAYGPKERPMEVIWPCDGTVYPPKGVRGGHEGQRCRHWKVGANGQEEELPNITILTIRKDEYVKGNQAGGGGYGDPLDRAPPPARAERRAGTLRDPRPGPRHLRGGVLGQRAGRPAG